MTRKEMIKRFNALGYLLVRHYKDAWGKKWPYARLPLGSGTTCVFNDLQAVEKNILDIEQIRSWEATMPPITAPQ